MTTIQTIEQIIREIQPKNHSMSAARRQIHLRGVCFKGVQVTSLLEEVVVEVGDIFRMGQSVWSWDSVRWKGGSRDGQSL